MNKTGLSHSVERADLGLSIGCSFAVWTRAPLGEVIHGTIFKTSQNLGSLSRRSLISPERSLPVYVRSVRDCPRARGRVSFPNAKSMIRNAHKPCSAPDNNMGDHAILRALSLSLLGRKAYRLANAASRCTMLQGVVLEYDSRERPRLSR